MLIITKSNKEKVNFINKYIKVLVIKLNRKYLNFIYIIVTTIV